MRIDDCAVLANQQLAKLDKFVSGSIITDVSDWHSRRHHSEMTFTEAGMRVNTSPLR
jgi:hypothetical protein